MWELDFANESLVVRPKSYGATLICSDYQSTMFGRINSRNLHLVVSLMFIFNVVKAKNSVLCLLSVASFALKQR